MNNTCDTCQEDYELTPTNTTVAVYMGCPEAQHALMKCSKGHVERMFIRPNVLEYLVLQVRCHGTIHPDAADEIKLTARVAWARAEGIKREQAPLPDLPPVLRRELYDFLRAPWES